MAKKNASQPVNPFHPGEILLEEFLQPAKITQAAFARKIGWTKARLNEFVRGRRGVTADAALDLGGPWYLGAIVDESAVDLGFVAG